MGEFKITKEQIEELYLLSKLNNIQQALDGLLHDWFPKAFEVELEVGKWYKCIEKEYESLVCITDFNNSKGYGFSYYSRPNPIYNGSECSINWSFKNDAKNWELATDQEVEAALINEAKKRGFKEGVYFLSAASKEPYKVLGNMFLVDGKLYNNNCGVLFVDGKWAEIIQTITKQEAEEKLGCKII